MRRRRLLLSFVMCLSALASTAAASLWAWSYRWERHVSFRVRGSAYQLGLTEGVLTLGNRPAWESAMRALKAHAPKQAALFREVTELQWRRDALETKRREAGLTENEEAEQGRLLAETTDAEAAAMASLHWPPPPHLVDYRVHTGGVLVVAAATGFAAAYLRSRTRGRGRRDSCPGLQCGVQ